MQISVPDMISAKEGDSREKRSKTGLGDGFIHPYLQRTGKQLMVNPALGVAR